MTVGETFSLIASIVSIAIGIFAVCLSITFYKMSSKISNDIKDAAKGIIADVEKIDKLFEIFYTDTFKLMRDIVADISKHAWPERELIDIETHKKVEEKADALKKQFDKDLANIFKKQTITEAKIDSIKDEIGNLMNRAFVESKKVEIEAREEAREETLRDYILVTLKAYQKRGIEILSAERLVAIITGTSDFTSPEIARQFQKIKDEGMISWEGGTERDSFIKIERKIF